MRLGPERQHGQLEWSLCMGHVNMRVALLAHSMYNILQCRAWYSLTNQACAFIAINLSSCTGTTTADTVKVQDRKTDAGYHEPRSNVRVIVSHSM